MLELAAIPDEFCLPFIIFRVSEIAFINVSINSVPGFSVKEKWSESNASIAQLSKLLCIPQIKHGHARKFSSAIPKRRLIKLNGKPIVEFIFNAQSQPKIKSNPVMFTNARFKKRSINISPRVK